VIVGTMLLRLSLPGSTSLKDKRQVVKSLTARLRNEFGVAAAEVGALQSWHTAELGIACVSNQGSHAEQVLDAVLRYVEETRPDLEAIGIVRDTFAPFS
jgi:uncharacterized protein YlxP (DUF503 family)